MAKIEFIKNKDEEIVYPKTHENAVLTADGLSLAEKFENIRLSLEDKADKNHTHPISEISNFPTVLPADGGDADSVGGKTPNDFSDPDKYTLWSSEKTKSEIEKAKTEAEEKIKKLELISIGSTTPTKTETLLWIDTSSSIPLLKFKLGEEWKLAGSNIAVVDE